MLSQLFVLPPPSLINSENYIFQSSVPFRLKKQNKAGRVGDDYKPKHFCDKPKCLRLKSEPAIIHKRVFHMLKKFASNYLYLILSNNPMRTNSIFQSDLTKERGLQGSYIHNWKNITLWPSLLQIYEIRLFATKILRYL